MMAAMFALVLVLAPSASAQRFRGGVSVSFGSGYSGYHYAPSYCAPVYYPPVYCPPVHRPVYYPSRGSCYTPRYSHRGHGRNFRGRR
jgi:hypothetical protein